MKVYIASPFFTNEQLCYVLNIEETLDEFEINYFSPRKSGSIKDMSESEKVKNAKIMYQRNVSELIACNVTLVNLDWKDTGTIFELGYAARLKEEIHNPRFPRKIITFSTTEKPVNLMLKYCIDIHAENYNYVGSVLEEFSQGELVPSNNNLRIDE